MNLSRKELELGHVASEMANTITIAIAEVSEKYISKVPAGDRHDVLMTAICLSLLDLYRGQERNFISFYKSINDMNNEMDSAENNQSRQ